MSGTSVAFQGDEALMTKEVGQEGIAPLAAFVGLF
jgi:hypothetical protein